MIIQYIIDKLISDKIKALNFTDRYAGVVSEMEITTNAVGAAKSYKKYPIAAGVSANDCNNPAIYQDLVPNDTKKSVIYWELTQPMQNVGRTPQVGTFNHQRYRGTARVIVWLNLKELGFSEVAPQNRTDGKIHTLPALMKAIKFDGKFSDGIYSGDRVQIIPTRVITDKTQIFGKYGYSKDVNWFLYPYDFFAIDVSFTLDTCLANPYEFPLGTAIDCVDYTNETPTTPETNSFTFDGNNESMVANDTTSYGFEINQPYSLSMWVKFLTVPAAQRIFAGKRNKATGAVTGYTVAINNGKLRYSMSSLSPSFAAIVIESVNAVMPNVWYNIVVTYDGSNSANGMNIYLDSVLQAKTTAFNTPVPSIVNAKPFVIGAGDVELYTHCVIANTRLWSKELTAGEILEEYNTGTIKPEPAANANCILDTDNGGSSWDGVNWTVSNKKGGASLVSSLMEFADKTTDLP